MYRMQFHDLFEATLEGRRWKSTDSEPLETLLNSISDSVFPGPDKPVIEDFVAQAALDYFKAGAQIIEHIPVPRPKNPAPPGTIF